MADIKDSVGDGGANRPHDVSLVQVMLRLVKDAKGSSYFGADYDGTFGSSTKDAIVRFQQDQKLVPLPSTFIGATAPQTKAPPAPQAKGPAVPTEKTGFIGAGSLTQKKLTDLLPPSHKDMRALPGTNLVYLPGAETAAKDFAKVVAAKIELDAGFRSKLANTVTQMYADHKIVLAIPGSGWRRDFAWQMKLKLAGTGAAPGESNHQYGQAADIGPNDLRWIAGDGSIARADYWLNPIGSAAKMPQSKRDRVWSARNDIAYKTFGLFPTSKAGDDVHVQGYSDATISYPRSLAKLLTAVGKAKWSAVGHTYKTDFGLGGNMFAVGSASDNWQGKALVTAANLVAAISAAGKDLAKLPVYKDFQYVKNALNAAAKAKMAPGSQFLAGKPGAVAKPAVQTIVDGKSMKAIDIKGADIAAVQKMLKEDWAGADTNWKKWTPVP